MDSDKKAGIEKWEWSKAFLKKFKSKQEAKDYINKNATSTRPGSIPMGKLVCIHKTKHDVYRIYEDKSGNCTYKSEKTEKFHKELMEDIRRRKRKIRGVETEEERRERELEKDWKRYFER